MILFFHFICLIARYIVSNISKSLSKGKLFWGDDTPDNLSENEASDCLREITGLVRYPIYENNTLKFFPPVYVQRYETVALILQDAAQKYKIKKVVDFGCSELGFLVYLKNIEGVIEILEVDIDSEKLERYSYKAAPLASDYLMGKRKKPLDVYILAGSIADYDDHLMGCDALVGIELIEHLTEDDLDKMPYNVFFKIKPKIVIFTTPNADFNCLFPNFTDLRHDDHKFEWTRKEFYDWTQKVLKLYPEYSVRFYGIGAGPEGTENLGCCTQMAVFNRSDDTDFFITAREESEGTHINYKLIEHYKYPIYIDNRTLEERIIHEVQYQVAHFSNLDTYYNYENNESEIPLCLLREFVSDLCSDDELLRKILMRNGMTLKQKDNSWVLVQSEVDCSESDITTKNDDWLNDEFSESFYNNDELFLSDRHLWDNELFSECAQKFESSVNDSWLGSNLPDDNGGLDNRNQECINASKEKIKSAPQSFNYLTKKMEVLNDKKLENNKKLKLSKSRIPRRKNERYDYFSGRNMKKTSVPDVCKFKKISKSFSLDSCLENINSKLFERESYYLNLIPAGSSSSNMGGSLIPEKRKHFKNCSDSSLLSSSLERAGDSGYPFSFSPPDDNLTPEQVDELFTESEMMSRSTSSSSQVDVVDFINHRLHRDVFIEDIPVENGDLANNNRDGEGNNVEGLMGQRLINEAQIERDPNDNLFFPEVAEFPPWLLNLGDLALQPVYFPFDDSDSDEGVGDDSGSCVDSSPDLDLDF